MKILLTRKYIFIRIDDSTGSWLAAATYLICESFKQNNSKLKNNNHVLILFVIFQKRMMMRQVWHLMPQQRMKSRTTSRLKCISPTLRWLGQLRHISSLYKQFPFSHNWWTWPNCIELPNHKRKYKLHQAKQSFANQNKVTSQNIMLNVQYVTGILLVVAIKQS